MNEDWRTRSYRTYTHDYLPIARGEQTLSLIRRQFVIWNKQYGKFLPSRKDARIIDIGCGDGELVLWLRELGYTNVSGVEADKTRIEAAERLGIAGIQAADFRDVLRDRANYYDCIIARDVLEHFSKEEIFGVLDGVFRALCSDGIFIMQTPNAESPFGSRYRYYDFTHCLAFTPTSLRHVLGAAGFKNSACYSVRPVVHGPLSLVRRLLWYVIEFKVRLYVLIETGSGKGVFTVNMIATARKQ